MHSQGGPCGGRRKSSCNHLNFLGELDDCSITVGSVGQLVPTLSFGRRGEGVPWGPPQASGEFSVGVALYLSDSE